MNTTSRYLHFSTCCSVLPLTSSTNYGLGLWRDIMPRSLIVLFFVPARSYATENRSRMLETSFRRRKQHQTVRKEKEWFCGSQQQQPRRLGCNCQSNWNRLWRKVVTAHTLVGLSESNTHCGRLWYNSTDAETNFWALGSGLTANNRRASTPTPKAFHQEPGPMLSRGRQNG